MQIALYCTYYARRSKEDVLKYVKGKRKYMHTYQEYIDDYYPHHPDEQNDILSKGFLCDSLGVISSFVNQDKNLFECVATIFFPMNPLPQTT